jgi:hypothetical protein
MTERYRISFPGGGGVRSHNDTIGLVDGTPEMERIGDNAVTVNKLCAHRFAYGLDNM